MYVGKWYTLAASATLQLVAGVAYTFSLYAPSLKAALKLSQPQLEGIGSAILCGGLTAWVPGILYDRLANYSKLAPRLTAAIGLVTHVAGYTTIWAAASGRLDIHYWLLIVAGLVASSGLLWLDTAAIATCLRNFPAERGSIAGALRSCCDKGLTLSQICIAANPKMVSNPCLRSSGILKTFLGLSASIATTVYSGAFAPHGLDFLLFLATGPAALGLLVVPLLNHVPFTEECETPQFGQKLKTGHRLLAICGAVCVLLLYQLLTALLGGSGPHWRLGKMVIALFILAACILPIPLGTGGVRSRPASRLPSSSDAAREEGSPLLTSPAPGERLQRRSTSSALEEAVIASEGQPPSLQAAGSNKAVKTPIPREWNLQQCLCSVDYWMLWLGLFIGIGSGFTLLNNFGQHVEALRAPEGAQQPYVLLFATFNCLGRMICGFGSEWLLHRYGFPRTGVLLGMSAFTAVIYFVIAFAGLDLLLACSVFAGLAFGSHWALMPSTTVDLFGPKHFAANQSGMHLSTAVGALLLSTELAGTLFERQGHEHGDPGSTCFGADCFRATYIAIGAIALVQTALSAILCLRSRPLYRQLYIKLQRPETGVL